MWGDVLGDVLGGLWNMGRWLAMLTTCGATLGCADDPFDLGQPRSCEVGDQNEWVLAVMQELYLFSDEMPTVDPLDFEDPAALVRALRVAPDRWSRVSDQARTTALFEEGKSIGFGFRTRRNAKDDVIVVSVHPRSPAGRAGLRRGDRFLAVDGRTSQELTQGDAWSGIYGPTEPGVTIPFVVDNGAGVGEREVTLVKDWIDILSVPTYEVIDTDEATVGYLFFETFVEPGIDELDGVFEAFNAAGVTDVVVDVRYNGGGLISVSQHLTDLLVGGVADGAVSFQVQYNDNFSGNNYAREVSRVTHSLPAVRQVAFITTSSSLSASELLINSVRAHTQVEIVGNTTGGKPVGSKHTKFCDSTLAPITFALSNAEGQGEYFDGLTPTCIAEDDLTSTLGDPTELSLAAALSLATGNGCPASAQATQAPDRDDGSRMDPGRAELELGH